MDYLDHAVASRTPNLTTRSKILLFWTRSIHLSDSCLFKRIATTTTQALNILEKPLNCITGFFCRAVLRQVINACHACRRQKAAGLQTQMADLPMCRFPTDTPFLFLHCGLDIFGPYPVFKKSMDPVHQKRSGLLITCLITRAVHEELTYSLPADSFINSFRRFVSRRGCPGSIKSDRATNCVGANKSLNEAIKVLISTDIANFFCSQGNSLGTQSRLSTIIWRCLRAPDSIIQRLYVFSPWLKNADR